MRTKRKFVDSFTKLLPVFHGQYREMCSLAAVGQLGGPQMCELNEHIATCDSCRKFLESVAQASVQVLPVLAEERISAADVATPVGMRSRFLAKLDAEPIRLDANKNRHRLEASEPGQRPKALGIKQRLVTSESGHRPEAPGRNPWGIEDPEEELVFQRVDPRELGEVPQRSSTHARVRFWPIAAALAASALIGVGGYYLGHRDIVRTPTSVAKQSPPIVPSSVEAVSPDDSDRVARLEREKATLELQLGALKGQLSASDVQQKELSEKLADANSKLTSLIAGQASSLEAKTNENVQETTNREKEMQVAMLQKEVTRLRAEFDGSIFKIIAQQHENDDLRSRLETTEANLQQELSLKDAKGQMGELVAARNLHIVDVYDADLNGKRQKAFGRVFYTEGKSLVFYAYDLEGAGQVKANVVFHVWGGKAGVKEVTHSLGILRKDDVGQARWAMTFDDANVLSQINSVFVTAEASNKHYEEPHGKKVLFAYFGSTPNHP